jgi:hypothetical protein
MAEAACETIFPALKRFWTVEILSRRWKRLHHGGKGFSAVKTGVSRERD